MLNKGNRLKDIMSASGVSANTIRKVKASLAPAEPKTALAKKAQKKYSEAVKKNEALHKEKNEGKITLAEYTERLKKLKA